MQVALTLLVAWHFFCYGHELLGQVSRYVARLLIASFQAGMACLPGLAPARARERFSIHEACRMLLVSTLHGGAGTGAPLRLRSLRVSELLSLIGILQGTTAAWRLSKYTGRAPWKYSLHRWKAEVGCGQIGMLFLEKASRCCSMDAIKHQFSFCDSRKGS
jgi:hypothetical protein